VVAGSLGQFGVTLWVLARWWRPKDQGGLAWPSITPALLIPVVGNVVAPLGGVALGHGDWATAQFGIGLLLWPVVLALLAARSLVQGPMPERLLPTAFILIAPPAVCGSAVLELGAPPAWAGCSGAWPCSPWAGPPRWRAACSPWPSR
jgi:tellurite resistance protein